MGYVGGIRARLIRQSLYEMVHDSLTALGWFSPGRQHLPFSFSAYSLQNTQEPIPFNTLALADGDVLSEDQEVGTLLSEFRWTYYLDFYGENDAISLHVTQDIKDILQGRMASIGRAQPNLRVYDYTMATPSAIFTCHIEDVVIDRANDFPQPWKRHWYAVRFDVVDAYADEESAYPFDGGSPAVPTEFDVDGGNP